MGRIGVDVLREPWGTVLILAPSNYPLFLPGVQIVQALAAGNAVLVKPAPGSEEVLQALKSCIVDAGIDEDLVQILPVGIEYAEEAMDQGVDKVFLTGSVHTGRAVMRRLSETLTPATMELSGCDAVFLTSQADLVRAAKCIHHALRMNGGATCIAPRRIFVTEPHREQFTEMLRQQFQQNPNEVFEIPKNVALATRRATEQALARGAEILVGELPEELLDRDATHCSMRPLILSNVDPRMEVVRSDLFAPIASLIAVNDMTEAINADRVCPYSLGASVFGPRSFAEHWASQIEAGCVVLNDIVVPTADPRVAFGGRDQSGWGSTRGAEGLLEMTRPKVLCTRYGNWLPHLDAEKSQDLQLLGQLMQLTHSGSLRSRFAALRKIIELGRKPQDVAVDDKGHEAQ